MRRAHYQGVIGVRRGPYVDVPDLGSETTSLGLAYCTCIPTHSYDPSEPSELPHIRYMRYKLQTYIGITQMNTQQEPYIDIR